MAINGLRSDEAREEKRAAANGKLAPTRPPQANVKIWRCQAQAHWYSEPAIRVPTAGSEQVAAYHAAVDDKASLLGDELRDEQRKVVLCSLAADVAACSVHMPTLPRVRVQLKVKQRRYQPLGRGSNTSRQRCVVQHSLLKRGNFTYVVETRLTIKQLDIQPDVAASEALHCTPVDVLFPVGPAAEQVLKAQPHSVERVVLNVWAKKIGNHAKGVPCGRGLGFRAGAGTNIDNELARRMWEEGGKLGRHQRYHIVVNKTSILILAIDL